MTATRLDKRPPLNPTTVGGKISVSCEKPGVFLIRAWSTMWHRPEKLVGWICHHVGRMDLDGLEWWGFTYPGQPAYMGTGTIARAHDSGLTIQRFIAPTDSWVVKAVAEGRIGPAYGEPEWLDIPERGVVLAQKNGNKEETCTP